MSAKAAAIDVPVYIIAVVLPIDDPGSDRATPGSKRQAPASIGTIEDLARWTGGALYYSSTSESAYTAARSVIDELRHLYLIAFEPGAEPGWHPIEIRTSQKDFVVRTRGGYVAGPMLGRESEEKINSELHICRVNRDRVSWLGRAIDRSWPHMVGEVPTGDRPCKTLRTQERVRATSRIKEVPPKAAAPAIGDQGHTTLPSRPTFSSSTEGGRTASACGELEGECAAIFGRCQ